MGGTGIWAALLLASAHFGCTGCTLRLAPQGILHSDVDLRSVERGACGAGSLPWLWALRLRGGGDHDFTQTEEEDSGSSIGPHHVKCIPEALGLHEPETPEEAAQFKMREDLWNQKFAEWSYCMEGEGRPLKPDPEPWEIPHFEEKDICWNYDGMNPPPEVWRNPKQEDRDMGWTVCPETAPIAEMIKDVLREEEEKEAEETRVKRDGPDFIGQEYDVDGNEGYDYWDRDGGTRPFTNLRSQLPPGWRQLKFAGSTLLLNPDGTFVCNDDCEVKDPNLWGADPNDRGEWRCDGPSWEESEVLTLAFNDEKKHVIQLRLHAETTLAGQTFAYTGEDPVLDPPLAEVLPNVHDGILCEDSECPRCADEHGSEDPNASSSGHEGERISIPEEEIPGLDELEARL